MTSFERLESYDALVLAMKGHFQAFVEHDFEAALELHDKAYRLNPYSSMVLLLNSCTYSYCGEPDKAIERLRHSGHVYEKEGALWFRSTDYGDEKDRVLVRDNGQTTYFASDIAYHMDKLERGFDRVIDIWGADHHGYVPRVKAALQALGDDPKKLDVLLVQFAVLYRSGEKVQMSTRSGEFVTLRQLRKEVGSDAARYFYVMRKCEQHMDFDLDLAKSRSNENPIYYIQYAHARICSVMRELETQGLDWDEARESFLRRIHDLGVAVRVFVVHPGPTTRPWGPAALVRRSCRS